MAFPTALDLAYWEAKHRPAWAASIAKAPKAPDIDSLVNAHAGVNVFPRRSSTETHNMCTFVSGWTRRSVPVLETLLELAHHADGPQPAKRKALCLKWASRITRTYKPFPEPRRF